MHQFSPSRRQWLQASAASLTALMFPGASPGAEEQERSALKFHTETPPNAEPVLSELVKSWITPNEKFYIRSHAPSPKLDADTFALSIEGLVHKPFTIRLAELKARFKEETTMATLTCAGNRRTEHSLTKPVKGVPWEAGAIGNATWTGVLLRELLKHAEVKADAKHVWFEGVDQIKRTSGVIPFGASIPLENAMRNREDHPGAMVAYGMNGQPLPIDHGFPFRTLVPGMIGARSVKWLGKLIVSDRPSTNHYLATAYKLVTEGTDEEWKVSPPIYHFVCNSVNCLPAPGTKITTPTVTTSGYALADGLRGRTVAKVELSSDGGKTWQTAKLTSPAKPMCWRLWSASVNVSENTNALLVRTTDSRGKVQPQTVKWNLKGYLFNAWHKTPIQVKQP